MDKTFVLFICIPAAAGVGLLLALVAAIWARTHPEGSREIVDIGRLIESGAQTFLRKEYSLLGGFLAIVTGAIGLTLGLDSAVCFVAGALVSVLAGITGMRTACRINGRTAFAAARHGQRSAFNIAFAGGASIGLGIAALGLLGVALLYSYVSSGDVAGGNPSDIMPLSCFAMGASSVALFARLGGGIFTKAADIGADLVGKVEEGIPEDDARNAASIADNVGDNVGDIAGMGADIFESYVGSIIATMLLGLSVVKSSDAVLLPLVIMAIGIVASIIGLAVAGTLQRIAPIRALRLAVLVATLVLVVGSFLVIRELAFTDFPDAMGPFYAIVMGVMVGIAIGMSAEYYTGTAYSPVRKIALAARTGSATNLIAGMAVGMYSCIPSVFGICAGIYFANEFSGLYGIGLAAVGMLAITGVIMTIDAMGPIADNAGGIVTMATLGSTSRQVTDTLDAIGNTSAAVGKGFAIGSAALTALAVFAAYVSAVGLTAINLVSPAVVVGLLLGGVLPFFIAANTMNAVAVTAQLIVEEVRRQFREIPGIRDSTGKPDSTRCIVIASDGALRGMLLPGMTAIMAPVIIGFTLGKVVLGGALAGAFITGVLLSLFMTNSGGAWDNAKKSIEMGLVEGETRNSEAYKAAVTGDTVGDPFKDTAGPAMNIVVKLVTTVALVIAPLL